MAVKDKHKSAVLLAVFVADKVLSKIHKLARAFWAMLRSTQIRDWNTFSPKAAVELHLFSVNSDGFMLGRTWKSLSERKSECFMVCFRVNVS